MLSENHAELDIHPGTSKKKVSFEPRHTYRQKTSDTVVKPSIRIVPPDIACDQRDIFSRSGHKSNKYRRIHSSQKRENIHSQLSVPQANMASSVISRQSSRQQIQPSLMLNKAQSQSVLLRPGVTKVWPATSTSPLYHTGNKSSPLFTRATSASRLNIRPAGDNSSPSQFSTKQLKMRSVSEILASRRKRSKAKAAKAQTKLTQSATVEQAEKTNKAVRKDGLTPLKRFRRAARLVKLLVTVSNVCRDLLVYAIKDEQWYEFCEKFLKDASAGGTPIDTHSFITTMKDPLTKEFVQLEFDSAQFKHDYHSGSSLLTSDIKAILNKRPGTRTQKEVDDCIQCIKRLVPAFRSYTFEQQKQICQLVMYDRYFQERVIIRENLPPDGIYFVLNGTLMESGKKMATPKIIKPGDKFGEEDLKSGMSRQNNVVTKSSVDLLYLHKFDYEEIFELSVDLSGDEFKVFEICKQEMVFKYYPIAELVRNPGRWQVLKFKYGRLIAADSCQTEFIYVIRCGEARVLKYIETRTINVALRRRRLQDELDSADPFVNRKKLLDFVSANKFQKSKYTLNAYSAKNLSADPTPIAEKVKQLSTLSANASDRKAIQRPKTALPKLESDGTEREDPLADSDEDEQNVSNFTGKAPKSRAQTAMSRRRATGKSALSSRPQTSKTVSFSSEENDMYRARKAATNKVVPPFVQVDSLQAGQTYGMRSLLSPDLQGEPAALVSAGCEVIQINRKFFAKYLDDNMINIIALKAKAYPSEEELLKRLDVNLQWEEYCAVVMCGYLDSKVVGFRGSHVVTPQ